MRYLLCTEIEEKCTVVCTFVYFGGQVCTFCALFQVKFPNKESIFLAVSFFVLSKISAYRSIVMVMVVCPKKSDISFGLAPAATISAAVVWRRS